MLKKGCNNQAKYQWQICADDNIYRTICLACDIELNRLVLKYVGDPDIKTKYKGIKMRDWLQNYRNKRFYPLDFKIGDLDIAAALSKICRFGGHCRDFYSVAQHSVYVSQYCGAKDALWGLLDDSAEAILGDLPSPLKRLPEFNFYTNAEFDIKLSILHQYQLPIFRPISVRITDKRVFITEVDQLMSEMNSDWMAIAKDFPPLDFVIKPLLPKDVEQLFLNRFNTLRSL